MLYNYAYMLRKQLRVFLLILQARNLALSYFNGYSQGILGYVGNSGNIILGYRTNNMGDGFCPKMGCIPQHIAYFVMKVMINH